MHCRAARWRARVPFTRRGRKGLCTARRGVRAAARAKRGDGATPTIERGAGVGATAASFRAPLPSRRMEISRLNTSTTLATAPLVVAPPPPADTDNSQGAAMSDGRDPAAAPRPARKAVSGAGSVD